ncbi:MAG: hypothetical protein GXO87_12530 [Chlorobi bacterium]|nr:hypothetical protein [Chlorobiota bacterium]
MKLAVVGHSVVDVVREKGKEKIQPGGIFYTAAALKAVAESGDELFLITSSDGKNDGYFAEAFDRFNLSLSQKTDTIPKVYLTIHEEKEREERFENFTQTLDVSKLSVPGFDGILINMISGNDILLEDLETLRKDYRGKIFIDIHALSKGVDEKNNRVFRLVPDYQRWLSCADVIQVNNCELKTISAEDEEFKRASEILSYGVKYLVVTKGELGVRMYYGKDGETASYFIAAKKFASVNKVGCGDVFGAVFFQSFLKTGDPYAALENANIAGGIVTTYNSTERFGLLKKDLISFDLGINKITN